MPVISPAIGVQSGSHSALSFRQLAAALTGSAVQTFVGGPTALDVGHGLVRPGMFAVVQNGTPNMSVNVGSGTALVNGSSVLAQGIYAVTNDATVNLAIATADATNPRRDLVCVQVRDDTADGSGFNDARLFVITGTPAASPVDPAVPAGCLVLARVQVAALAASIVNANITTLAGLARGSSWNQAWGIVAFARVTTATVNVTAAVDATGMTATWNAVAGRRYKTTVSGHYGGTVANDILRVALADGANATQKDFNALLKQVTFAESFEYSHVENASLSGSQTRKVRVSRTAGTGIMQFYADAAAFIAHVLVEDIGPI